MRRTPFPRAGARSRTAASIALAVTPLALLPLLPPGSPPLQPVRLDAVGLGLLALAVFVFGAALAERRGPTPARAYLLAGLSSGGLVLMGPYGAAVVALALGCLAAFPQHRRVRRPERRAEFLILAFVPAFVFTGVVFVGWSRTGTSPAALLAAAMSQGDVLVPRSEWLAQFGGGAAMSWPLLIGTAILCCPWLAGTPRGNPQRTATLLVIAGVAAAGILTAANLFDDPAALLVLCAGASAVALRGQPAPRRALPLLLSACGLVFALTALSAFLQTGRPQTLVWSLGRQLDQPPAWGVALSARDRFFHETGQPLDALAPR